MYSPRQPVYLAMIRTVCELFSFIMFFFLICNVMNIPYFFQVTDFNQEKKHEVLKTLLNARRWVG
jgi:hypothetical protein